MFLAYLGVYMGMGAILKQQCCLPLTGRVHGGWALFRVGVYRGFYGMGVEPGSDPQYARGGGGGGLETTPCVRRVFFDRSCMSS